MERFCVIFLIICLGSYSSVYSRGDTSVRCSSWEPISETIESAFRFCKENLTWDDAQMSCFYQGGNLASISSYELVTALWDYLLSNAFVGNSIFWVGLRYEDFNSQWIWINRHSLNTDLVSWRIGEPNNEGGKEKCGELRQSPPGERSYQLNDNNCSDQRYYLCQRPYLTTTDKPTTSTTVTTTTTTVTTTSMTTTEDKARMLCYDIGGLEGNTDGKTVDYPQPIYDYETGEVYYTCPAVRVDNFNWPETRAGEVISVPCADGKGFAWWRCGQNPTCWRGNPNITMCASQQIRKLLQQTNKPLSINEASTLASTLASATENSDISIADISLTTQVIAGLGDLKARVDTDNPKEEKQQVENLVTNVAKVGSNLVSERHLDTWSNLTKPERLKTAAILLVALETTTVSLADRIDTPTVLAKSDENLDLKLHVIDVKSSAGDLEYGNQSSGNVLFIPIGNLRAMEQGGLARAVFMTHYRMADILGDKMTSTKDKSGGAVLTSNVVSASLQQQSQETTTPRNLVEPVTFTLKHFQALKQDSRVLCSFLRINGSQQDLWSQDGCVVLHSNASHTTCKCDHLTNFAILLDVTGVELSEHHLAALWYITLIGCIISILCLLASWITFQFLSSLQGERNSIHKNLTVCLFISEVIFLAGIDKTRNRVGCGIVAGFLHYFLLCCFTWMFLEGLHIIFMLVQVFDAARSRLKYYYMAGYGVPLLIVVVSVAAYHQGYGTDRHCWLTTDRMFILSFAIPVAIILTINAIILTFSMIKVCQHSEFVFNTKEKSTGNTRSWIQGALAMEVLLGVTWIFGYFFISESTVAFAYIFTILNCLQGLFIFIFHCVLNKKVRKEYARTFGCTKDGSSTFTSSRFLMRKPETTSESAGAGTH